jgi:hypothetical protein
MNLEEYKEAVKKAKAKYEKEVHSIRIAYVNANNQFSIGDVITDGNQRIKIESAKLGLDFNGNPKIIYLGEALRVNLESYKRPRKDLISGNKELKKLNK